MNLGYNKTFLTLDKGYIDHLGPLGASKSISPLSANLSNSLSGYLYHYAFMFILTLAFFIESHDFFELINHYDINTGLYFSITFAFFLVNTIFNQD